MNRVSLFDDLPLAPPPARPQLGVSQPPEEKLLVRLVIDGEPVAKGRPRTRIVRPRFGEAFVHHYQPKETADYEERIRKEALSVFKGCQVIEDRPIWLTVRAFITIPASWPQKRKCEALRDELRPLGRPDHDNYMKIVSDALNGIIYRDDSLVTDSYQIKRYAAEPRMEIEVFI